MEPDRRQKLTILNLARMDRRVHRQGLAAALVVPRYGQPVTV
jgi:hypothetical protein